MNKTSFIRVALILTIFVSLLTLQYLFDLSSYFSQQQIREWLVSGGPFAPMIYILTMALAVIVSPIPSLPLDMAAGAFFGPLLGTLYSVSGALIGAVISFMISRLLGRKFMERFLGGHINLCESCSDKLLTRVVFISRLLPVVSFDIVSYGAGLTKMSLKKFSIATFFGMIPLTFTYNYFGAVLVFGKGTTVVLGVLMVILFFALPAWMERKGAAIKFMHKTEDR